MKRESRREARPLDGRAPSRSERVELGAWWRHLVHVPPIDRRWILGNLHPRQILFVDALPFTGGLDLLDCVVHRLRVLRVALGDTASVRLDGELSADDLVLVWRLLDEPEEDDVVG